MTRPPTTDIDRAINPNAMKAANSSSSSGAVRPAVRPTPGRPKGRTRVPGVLVSLLAVVVALAVVAWLGDRLSPSRAAALPINGSGYLSVPVDNTYVTSPYGMRMHPILHVRMLHDGTDLHAPCGTPVYAAAPGRVTSENDLSGYGNQLMIDHGQVHGVSLRTSYNHLSSYAVDVGQRVRRRQLIAFSGDTGRTTACHLHFMVYVDNATVDPMTWL